MVEPSVFNPRQHNDDRVEDRQRDHPERGGQIVSIHLVSAERGKDDDRRWVRPALSAQECPDEKDFDNAMNQQINRGEELGTGTELLEHPEQVRCDEVVRIFAELVLRHGCYRTADRLRRHDEKQQGSDDLRYAVESLEKDADLESRMKR